MALPCHAMHDTHRESSKELLEPVWRLVLLWSGESNGRRRLPSLEETVEGFDGLSLSGLAELSERECVRVALHDGVDGGHELLCRRKCFRVERGSGGEAEAGGGEAEIGSEEGDAACECTADQCCKLHIETSPVQAVWKRVESCIEKVAMAGCFRHERI